MQVEFDIESCHATGLTGDGCIDTKRISLDMPFAGHVIYGVAHQHSGGSGSALYREVCKCVSTLHFHATFPLYFLVYRKGALYIEKAVLVYIVLFIFTRNFHLNGHIL